MTTQELEAIGALFRIFGPAASLIIVGYAAIKSLTPLAKAYLQQQESYLRKQDAFIQAQAEMLKGIADMVEGIEQHQKGVEIWLHRIENDIDYIQEDLAGIYEARHAPRPSRTRREKKSSDAPT